MIGAKFQSVRREALLTARITVRKSPSRQRDVQPKGEASWNADKAAKASPALTSTRGSFFEAAAIGTPDESLSTAAATGASKLAFKALTRGGGGGGRGI